MKVPMQLVQFGRFSPLAVRLALVPALGVALGVEVIGEGLLGICGTARDRDRNLFFGEIVHMVCKIAEVGEGLVDVRAEVEKE